MENLNNIEKITLLLSLCIVGAANLFVVVKQTESKKISKALAVIFIIGNSFFMKAQDTIYFMNSSAVCAKINEIGISEIKYNRFDNISGPNYTVSKTEIKKIRYSNGIIDSTSFLNPKVEASKINPPVKAMVLTGTDIYYNGKIQGEFAMHRLISTHALSENQLQLVKDLKKLKQQEKGYNTLGTGLFVTGFAVPAIVTLGSLSGSSNSMEPANAVQNIVAGALVGALLRISGHVVMKIGKNKTKAKKLDFLQKYNQNEIIY